MDGIGRSGDRSVRLATAAGPVEAHVVITCGGLYSDRLARMTDEMLDATSEWLPQFAPAVVR